MTAPPDLDKGKVVCVQTWRRLLFVHWPFPPEEVRARVPAGLELDLADGSAWISVVAFAIEGARTPHTPEPLGLDFLETNVRTYVRQAGGEPAVWFFSLEAASRLAVWGARLRYGLPYVYAEMEESVDGSRVAYRTERRRGGAGLSARYRIGPRRGTAEPGSLDHALVERYLLHARRGERWRTVGVRHDPYRIRDVEIRALEENLVEAAGLPAPTGPPTRAHFVERVDVEIVEPAGDVEPTPEGR